MFICFPFSVPTLVGDSRIQAEEIRATLPQLLHPARRAGHRRTDRTPAHRTNLLNFVIQYKIN